MSPERIDAIVDRTRNGGAEVVGLLKTGSAFYAPAASTYQMVDAILNDRHMILPCAAYLTGPYGVDGLYVGVPVRLGRSGIEEVVTIELTPGEQAAFDASAASVRDLVTRMAEMGTAAG
jgi:malate dehydrogenase